MIWCGVSTRFANTHLNIYSFSGNQHWDDFLVNNCNTASDDTKMWRLGGFWLTEADNSPCYPTVTHLHHFLEAAISLCLLTPPAAALYAFTLLFFKKKKQNAFYAQIHLLSRQPSPAASSGQRAKNLTALKLSALATPSTSSEETLIKSRNSLCLHLTRITWLGGWATTAELLSSDVENYSNT